MTCPHYYNGVCKAINQTVSKTTRDNTCLTSQAYGKCPYYKQSQPSLCFITSAVCESQGKSDDCYELTLMRSFRDNWLRKQKDGLSVIDDYYACAPHIVEEIDKRPESKSIWQHIDENLHSSLYSFY